MAVKRLFSSFVLLLLALGMFGSTGCGNSFDQSFKLMSRTLPSLGTILKGVLCNGVIGEIPAIMRFNFNGKLGWITFEERYQGRVLASYRLEMSHGTVSVPGEYGLVENPGMHIPLGDTLCGMMELSRKGRLLQGFFQHQVPTEEKGELILQFSHDMQNFIGKWRTDGDNSWSENLTGSAN